VPTEQLGSEIIFLLSCSAQEFPHLVYSSQKLEATDVGSLKTHST